MIHTMYTLGDKCIFLSVFSGKFYVCLRLYKAERRVYFNTSLFDVECANLLLCVSSAVFWSLALVQQVWPQQNNSATLVQRSVLSQYFS